MADDSLLLRDIVTPGRHAAIVGTTASGKSALAMALARRATATGSRPIEIVTVDSMQVYRGMDIGTAKPTPAEQAEVPHHLIDIVGPDEEYTVARFARDVRAVLAGIEARGARALLVGGTGLYARAATDDLDVPGQFPEVRAALEHEPDTAGLHARLHELDPVAAARMEPTNRRRVVRALEVCLGAERPFSSFGAGLTTYPPTPIVIVGVARPRPEVDDRIQQRFDRLLADGFVDEVRDLARRQPPIARTAAQALGYRELLAHVRGECELGDAVAEALLHTRQFARRQERWFRRDPRIRWFDAGGRIDAVADDVETFLGRGDQPGARAESSPESRPSLKG